MKRELAMCALGGLVSLGFAQPQVQPWPTQGVGGAVACDAADLSGWYATADTASDTVEIRDVRGGLLETITRAELAAVVTWMTLDGSADGPSALAWSDSGRLLFIAVHDDEPGGGGLGSDAALTPCCDRWLSERYAAMGPGDEARSVVFIAFGAEEMGLIGADYFMDHAPIGHGSMVGMVNIDMIGRLGEEGLYVLGVGTAEELPALAERWAQRTGIDAKLREAGVGASDHTAFYKRGVPAVHLFSGAHDDYHTVRDTFEHLNYAGIVRVARMAEGMAFDIATGPRMTFIETTTQVDTSRNRTGSGVRFGIMPGSYGETDEAGVEVGAVFPGTPAAEAGLEKGDRLLSWNGEVLAGVRDFSDRLKRAAPGDVVELVVVRDGERIDTRATLTARGGGE